MGGTCVQQGDYLILCLKLLADNEERDIGVWGQQHLHYLKTHHKITYTNLLTTGKPNDYLVDINELAEDIFFGS